MFEVEKFYGKYRGTVVDNKDPNGLGRVQVQVPDVLGTVNTLWAVPCEPYAGPGVGFFAIPPIGACVWVEFEAGNYTLPIWTGGYWTTTADMPLSPATADTKLFCSEGVFLAHNNSADSVKVGQVAIEKGLTLYVQSPAIDEGFLSLFMGKDSSGVMIKINNNDKETITMTDQSIVISKEGTAVITLTKSSIESQTGNTDVLMDSNSTTITIKTQAATITLDNNKIDSTIGSSDLQLTAAKIDASCGGGDVSIQPTAVNASIGASSVALSPASVSINNGALEVM
jgi:uncharacterized protein involved in type VI secretion and phage assembly